MTIDETYNVHKTINCIFPFFKSKRLCKKGIHNYQFERSKEFIWKCVCCGKEEKIDA